MMWTANLVLMCLLAIAGFSGHGDAARTPQQRREQRNPYLVLPPGAPDSFDAGRPSQDLGERDFVGNAATGIASQANDTQTLRHIYHRGSHTYPRLHRYLDVPTDARLRVTDDYGETYEAAPTELRARVASTSIQRLAKRKPADIDRLLQHADIHGEAATLPSSAWTVDEIAGPNVTDRKTVLTFAKMAANAYVQEHSGGEWKDVKGGFNYTDDFGWQEDGLRGHIFADETNKTIVIGLKGTSVPWFDAPDTTDTDLVS